MNQKMKRDQDDFIWMPLEVKASKGIDSLPKSLQEKLATRNIKAQDDKSKKF